MSESETAELVTRDESAAPEPTPPYCTDYVQERMFQISLAYSRIVLSLENFPDAAVFRIAC